MVVRHCAFNLPQQSSEYLDKLQRVWVHALAPNAVAVENIWRVVALQPIEQVGSIFKVVVVTHMVQNALFYQQLPELDGVLLRHSVLVHECCNCFLPGKALLVQRQIVFEIVRWQDDLKFIVSSSTLTFALLPPPFVVGKRTLSTSGRGGGG